MMPLSEQEEFELLSLERERAGYGALQGTEQQAPDQSDIEISKAEAILRGGIYGAIQQPRDVAAALYAKVFGGIPFKEGLEVAKEMSLEGKQGQAKKDRSGYFTGGQIAGNILTSLAPASMATKAVGATAPTLSGVPVAGKALGATARNIAASKGLIGVPAAGAIQGAALTGMTEGDLSGAIPGAIGAGVVSAAGKVARPIAKEGVSKARRAYVELLKKEGITDLTPGQLTGNKTLELLDSVLENMPFTAGRARKTTEKQLHQFTKAALKFAGQKGDEITPEVRGAIEAQFNQRYSDLIGKEIVKIDDDVYKKMSEIMADQYDALPTNVKPIIGKYIKDIINSKGEMTGKAYQRARSAMTKQANSLSISDPFTSDVLRSVRNSLDEAAERSLPEAKKGLWKQLNKQYANYKAIQKAASAVSEDSLEGILSPAALNRAVESASKTKGQASYGALYPLSRAGRAVLAPSVPNSGTAQRQLAQQIITGGGLGLGAGGVTYGATQDPNAAILALAIALGGPKAVQSFLNSPSGRAYFTTGIPGANLLATHQARTLAAALSGAIGGNQ